MNHLDMLPQSAPVGRTPKFDMADEQTVMGPGARGQDSVFAEPFPKQATITLPKGGGALKPIDEKFRANPMTGSGTMTIPIAVSPGRSGSSPALSLDYDSGNGNGAFGLGWSLSVPSISRRTGKGLPTYDDEFDTFMLTGREDLVPLLSSDNTDAFNEKPRDGYTVRRYSPRIEGTFARIERWKSNSDPTDVHWRTIAPDNAITLYGIDSNSRVVDPFDQTRVFQWMAAANFDTSGNAIVYRYKSEDSKSVQITAVHEQNRTQVGRSANKYVKSIKYGNRRPMTPSLFLLESTDDWMFELIFDYGEHDTTDPKPTDSGTWPCRQDAFSSYSTAFEIRMYRLCRRVLMFHRFPEEFGEPATLVRSTSFTYKETSAVSSLTSVVLSGHVRRQSGQPYITKTLPPTEFEYSTALTPERLSSHDVHVVDSKSTDNLPIGVDNAAYQWVDLDGEGIPGILSEVSTEWFYKRNTSAGNRTKKTSHSGQSQTEARFNPLEILASKPKTNSLDSGQTSLSDLDGDSFVEIVDWRNPTPSVSLRYKDVQQVGGVDEVAWSPLHPYESWPSIDIRHPNIRPMDVTGNGRPDVLQIQDNVLYWYPSLGYQGFGPGRVTIADGPAALSLAFDDVEARVHVASVSGGGMSDLVCIQNGIVSYWPNLGYGQFGPRITMDNSPWFSTLDLFDHRRIRLADVDGTGTADLIYLTPNGFNLYRNLSGNSWSDAESYSLFPHIIQDVDTVDVVDLLGNGTACLVWSSKLPGDSGQQMLYLDLMGGLKPHLLTQIKNNFGGETRIYYAPSTYFSTRDSEAGRPWLTKLPFPVHCVERVVSVDRTSQTRFTSRYAYHHGCYDTNEREFRGFAAVEQWDAEELDVIAADNGEETEMPVNLDAASYSPPVHTKLWYHTGVYVGQKDLSQELASEFYGAPPRKDPSFKDFLGKILRASNVQELSAHLTDEELPEACRALKGLLLRKEIYSDDALSDGNTEAQARSLRPYSISETRYIVTLIQPRGRNKNAVFYSQPREGLTYNLERNPNDARVSHNMVLQVDSFGKSLRSLTVVYGRQKGNSALEPTDALLQEKSHLLYSETDYTNMIDLEDDYRLPAPCEARSYELTGFQPLTGRFDMSDFVVDSFAMLRNAAEVPFENLDVAQSPQRRLLQRSRTLFRSNDLTSLLPLGRIESRAVPGESYALVLTPGLLASVFKRTKEDGSIVNLLASPSSVLAGRDGGYNDLDGDGFYWTSAGRIYYHPDPTASPSTELAFATDNFFLPCRFTDVFGNDGVVEFDPYKLLTVATQDAYQNRTEAVNDYRVLQTRIVRDPNGNRAEVAFDALGIVVGSAIMGKEGENVGDNLDDFNPDLGQKEIDKFYEHPKGQIALDLLKTATSRVIYDLDRFWKETDPSKKEPPYSATILRETHVSENKSTETQVEFAYHGGFNQIVQAKGPAESGPLVHDGPRVSSRWLGSGWTITNNKDLPIKQYEPFFDETHHFKFDYRNGITPITFYDVVSRVIGMVGPNHTYAKVKFDAWTQSTYDCNDTVTTNPKDDVDLGPHFRRLPEHDYLPTWYESRINGDRGAEQAAAATAAAKHANTPSTIHLDSLGRPFLSILDNGDAGKYSSRNFLDIQGNVRAAKDSLGRIIHRQDYDMLGNVIHDSSMEAGEAWYLSNALGGCLRTWNSRGFDFRYTYDSVQRPVDLWVSDDGGSNEKLLQRTVYGESQASPDPQVANTRTRIIKIFDQSGVLENGEYDFKGNLIQCSRQLAVEYKNSLDWSTNVELETSEGEPIKYVFTQRYDALNRMIQQVAPDGSVFEPSYNEASMFSSLRVNTKGERNANGQLDWTSFVKGVEYDSRGLRTNASLGNSTNVITTYDLETSRLLRLQTTRANESNALQDLNYTYDPVGNIVQCRDEAQQTFFFRNTRVDPSTKYVYDALYRLKEATGKEHLGQNHSNSAPRAIDMSRTRLSHPGDGNAMGLYTESYDYDSVGNILKMRHASSDSSSGGNWTRTYDYSEESQLERSKFSNRLSSTHKGTEEEKYGYDGSNAGLHGLATSLPQLKVIQWNESDLLQASAQQRVTNGGIPEMTYYCYGNGGARIRKVTERQASAGGTPTRLKERVYLGIFEIYREYAGDGRTVTLERETLHVMDDQSRVALVESRTRGNDESPPRLVRYQYDNLIGSSTLELDDSAHIISYQEYYPYGASSYQAVSGATEVPKRFQFCGKERDEESGLDYSGARYYASWIGRWISADPGGLIDGSNLYRYVQCNPISMSDPSGYQTERKEETVWRGPLNGTGPNGSFTQEDARKLYLEQGIEYTGEARMVEPGHWVIDEEQKIKRTPVEHRPKSDGTNGSKPSSGESVAKPAPTSEAPSQGTSAPSAEIGKGKPGETGGGGAGKDAGNLIGHFAKGFAIGALEGFIGGLAIGALLAGGPIAVGIGVAAILAGSFMAGQTIAELAFGNASAEDKAETIGGLVGGLLGGLAGGATFKAFKGTAPPILEDTAPGGKGSPPVDVAPPEPPAGGRPSAGGGAAEPPAPPPPPTGAALRVAVVTQLEAAVAQSVADVDAAIATKNQGMLRSLNLSVKQINNLLAGSKMERGNAVQNALAQKIANDPLLSKHVTVLFRPFLATVDLLLEFPDGSSFYADLTTNTPRSIRGHFNSYGKRVMLLLY